VGAAWSTVWTEAFLTVCCGIALAWMLRRGRLMTSSAAAEPMMVGG
jgi:hypothetical protein